MAIYNLNIYRVDFEQATLHQLTEADGRLNYGTPLLSPDGQHITFWGFELGNNANSSIDTFKLYVMDADGSNLHILMDTRLRHSTMGWSPDSTKIAFSAAEGVTTADIYIIDIRDSNNQQLTKGPARDSFGDWSPDGKQIVFSRSSNSFANWQLFIMDANGENPRYLADCGNNDCAPDWR